MTLPKRRRLDLEALEELVEGLEEIRSMLPTASSADTDDEDEDIEAGQIESAEVEVELNSLLSRMTLTCKLKKEPDSLAELFEKLFSPEEELVALAHNLEDSVNGYFGELFGEDLDSADDYLAGIIEILKRKRDKWKGHINSQAKLKAD